MIITNEIKTSKVLLNITWPLIVIVKTYTLVIQARNWTLNHLKSIFNCFRVIYNVKNFSFLYILVIWKNWGYSQKMWAILILVWNLLFYMRQWKIRYRYFLVRFRRRIAHSKHYQPERLKFQRKKPCFFGIRTQDFWVSRQHLEQLSYWCCIFALIRFELEDKFNLYSVLCYMRQVATHPS
jgi:hypothetical protein